MGIDITAFVEYRAKDGKEFEWCCYVDIGRDGEGYLQGFEGVRIKWVIIFQI